jgi:retron-type reverse transcriptase
VTVDLLRTAYLKLKRDAAPGVDGTTWREYGHDLEAKLVDLHGRVHRGAYRALPSRRKFIQKEDGRERPLGIAALEDKIVQRAVVEVWFEELFVVAFEELFVVGCRGASAGRHVRS